MLELIIAARDGSGAALDALLKHYRPLLLSVARQELPQPLAGKVAPSSIVQQSCIDALRDIHQLRAQSEPECRAWLTQIVRMNIADATRRYLYTEKRELAREVPLTAGGSNPLLATLVCSEVAPEAAAIAREEGERLVSALARLSEQTRQVIEWHNRDHLSFVEIGEKLGKSPDAVRMIWNRGVKQLARELPRDVLP